jgi:DNA-directed RNA polymerase III subunit RPC4
MTNGNQTKIKLEPGVESERSEEYHRMDKLFNAEPNQLLLFQLPDSIPGRVSEEEVENEKNEKPSTSTSTEAAPKPNEPPSLCSLDHLEDGQIGKLIRHRSGKTKLLIGDAVFDINSGLQCDFLQNAVTIESNSQQRSASMYSLGGVNGKFNITPDWNWLFEQMKP